MIDTEALRKKIIDLAIKGKLTQQLPEDGNTEDLYTKIQAKKEELIKEGKIKKEKQQLDIVDEEIPFTIPSSWKWCRLESIFNFIDYRGATPNKIAKGVPFVTAKNVRQGYTDYSIKEYISEEDYLKRQSRGISHKGDLLFTTEAPMGYVAIADLERFSAGQRLITLQQYTDDPLINNKYYMYCISASFFQKQLEEKCSGTTVKGIKADRLKLFLIPLPPIEEQCRMVNLLDSVVNQLAIIDTLQHQYESDREILKGKIIDAGIRGKLTEQLLEDGNAEDLYEQIQEEKAKLIKEGKIKKEKPLPEIAKDEIPFEIPKNWKWIRWGDLSNKIQYGYNAPAKQDGRIKMVRISDIQDGEVQWSVVPYCDIDESEIENYLLHENDILFARTGGTVGKSFIVSVVPEEAVYAGYLIRTSYSSRICAQYMKYFMDSSLYWKQLRQGTIATAQPNCNGQTLSKMIVPFPPYEEQKRIVQKIDEIMNLIS